MKILIIHREGEEDKINILTEHLEKNGINSMSLMEDKKMFFTSSMKSWIRNCVTGYTIDGDKRYDGFMVIGKYLDDLGREFCKLVLSECEPLWYVENGVHRMQRFNDDGEVG
jgi:hypothetical protein|tara:strand:+ start:3594 stop:3929 length:336 start_codon:yes stop_codon:yes gene_type:complete